MIDANCPACESAKYDRHSLGGQRWVKCEDCGFKRDIPSNE